MFEMFGCVIGFLDPVSLGLIGGAVLGAGVSGAFSARQARQQSAFQEKSYKHRYQWTVADLQKAGLNPKLAVGANVGSGLSGAMGSMPAPDVMGAMVRGPVLKHQVASAKHGAVAAMHDANYSKNRAMMSEIERKRMENAFNVVDKGGSAVIPAWLDRISDWINFSGGGSYVGLNKLAATKEVPLTSGKKVAIDHSVTLPPGKHKQYRQKKEHRGSGRGYEWADPSRPSPRNYPWKLIKRGKKR